jgi:hypothetical protein
MAVAMLLFWAAHSGEGHANGTVSEQPRMDYANWLRSNEPQSPLEEIAERLIKRHTKNSASMGAITALPSNIPVVGTIMSVGGQVT